MKHLVLIFLGGGLGSLARFFLSKYLNPLLSIFPLGTFLSNVFASFLLGFFFAIIDNKPHLASLVPPLVLIGFCGGFSTFSTFSYDNFLLLKSGNYAGLLINLVFNIVICFLAIFAGIKGGNFFYHNT